MYIQRYHREGDYATDKYRIEPNVRGAKFQTFQNVAEIFFVDAVMCIIIRKFLHAKFSRSILEKKTKKFVP